MMTVSVKALMETIQETKVYSLPEILTILHG